MNTRYEIDQDGKMSAYKDGDWIKYKVCEWKLVEVDVNEWAYEICDTSLSKEDGDDIDGEFCPYCGGEVKLVKEIETHYGETK